MTHGSTFTGVGGFDLRFERAGIETLWQIENDEFCTRVLERHWPNVQRFRDIRESRNLPYVDVISGGFPCQPFSSAAHGRNTGEADNRFLWPEMLRVVGEVRPSWVVVENVVHLRGAVLEKVVSDLEAIGYEVGTLEIPACAFGHDHRRQRVWILGYTDRNGQSVSSVNAETPRLPRCDSDTGGMGKTYGVPSRMDRLRTVGNAVVPQIAEWLGKAIAL